MRPSARDAAGEVVPVRLPDAGSLFARRAGRLAALAEGHAAGPYLAFLAALARGQDAAARALHPPRAGEGPLPLDPRRVAGGSAFPLWREALRAVLESARQAPLPEPARETVAGLGAAGAGELDALADEVLGGGPRDLAAAPFVGAALQVLFARLAGGLDAASLERGGAGCPACGSGPVAAVVLGVERLRYLVCALCATEWHLPRVRCASCQATDRLHNLAIEPGDPGDAGDAIAQPLPGPVRAEVCDACHRYVKLLDLERLPGADAAADDAATLVLDLLVAERGYRRAGPNVLAPVGESG